MAKGDLKKNQILFSRTTAQEMPKLTQKLL